MPINTTVLDETEFKKILKQYLIAWEGYYPEGYVDTAGLPSIGIGFNLTVSSVRGKVFSAMGISGEILTKLTKIIEDSTGSNTTPADFLTKMSTAYGKSFEMTDEQITTVFSDLASSHTAKAMTFSGLSYSKELVVITAMDFNSPKLLGNDLMLALHSANPEDARAEAWYQIRYSHANQLWKRRYADSDFFGLYDDDEVSQSLKNSIAVYRMLSNHLEEAVSGSAGIVDYERAHGKDVAQANMDFKKVGLPEAAKSLNANLNLAAYTLVTKLGMSDLSRSSIKPTDITLESDMCVC